VRVDTTTLLEALKSLKSGKITVSQDNKEAVEVNVSDKKIDVDAKDKEFIKDILSSVREAGSSGGSKGGGLSIGSDSLKGIRDIANDLSREGVTITVSYKGDRVLTIGAEADSKLTRILTGTKGVQINNLLKLAELGL
jgi:signal transduction histidine kinase